MSLTKQQNIEAATKWLKNRFNCDEEEIIEHLDDFVHDLANQIASGVNNDGIDSQIEFIVEQCGERTTQTLLDEFGTGEMSVGDAMSAINSAKREEGV